jgi:L-seryl-tRNA(Ser) seleniumtransferase
MRLGGPAVKIEPRLPPLPSLGELLEHPRVKGLVARVNRSTIAQRAGGFLEEIRASLAERAGRVEIPSLAHLAERLARRLLGEPAAAGPVINATGVVHGDDAYGAPLPEAALHAIVQLAGEFHRRDPSAVRAAERGLCELAGGEAACLVSTMEGAVTLALDALAGGREVLVYGGDGARPIDWRWLAARAGAVVTYGSSLPAPSPAAGKVGEGGEAGAGAITSPPARHRGSGGGKEYSVLVRTPDAEDIPLADLAAAKPDECCLIDLAAVAGMINPNDHGYPSVETIGDRLAAGADLVVVDGAGLLGGPSCGVVIGGRRFVEQLARRPLASLLTPEALTVAAFEPLLKLYRESDDKPAIYQIPVWQLLSAPAANLELRARRLAALMAEAPGIASAEAREVESAWRRWGARTWTAKSWCIDLRSSQGDPAALATKLGHGPYPIAARTQGDAVQLDLRTVFPRWDQQLVKAVEALNRRDRGDDRPRDDAPREESVAAPVVP